MRIITAMQNKSDKYVNGRLGNITPIGIVVHSTGCNNPYAKRYVNAPDELGENYYQNWFGGKYSNDVLPHGVIGKGKTDAPVVCQILPFNLPCQGCGSGSKGSYNWLNGKGFIQFEICEDDLKDEKYFNAAFDLAAEFCACLMAQYPTIKLEDIVSHKEANARGYASAHGDPENWLNNYKKDMNWFRDKVAALRKTTNNPEEGSDIFYKVQVGAFKYRENAEAYLEKLRDAGFDGFITKG